jgi:putative glutamine amidotransferase
MALNIWLAGGRAVKWMSEADVDLDHVEAVIIGGGDDIAPTLYGGSLSVEVRLDSARDALEKAILCRAFARGMPVLGICRGAQMLNIVLGGTLHQNAFEHYRAQKRYTILPRRKIDVVKDSRLADISGRGPMRVNSLHSQSVDRLGKGLRVAAVDRHGMVQAVERVRDPFALGVQWHPEHLFYRKRQRALFSALVAAARAARDDRAQLAAVDDALQQNLLV